MYNVFVLPNVNFNHAILQKKLRVVFDGSIITKAGASFNMMMCNGIIIQSQLFEIIISFRTFEGVITCDIRHM